MFCARQFVWILLLVIWLASPVLVGQPGDLWAAGPTRYLTQNVSVPQSDGPVYAQAEMGYMQASMIQSHADMLRAQAEMVKAQAAAAESYAKVQETMEKVRTLALDNQLKAAKNFYDKRKMWEEYKALHPRDRVTAEEASRYSRAAVPKRLESYQLDSRGVLFWPAVFDRPEFAEHRQAIDRLFKNRQPRDAGPESDFYRQVNEEVGNLRRELRAIIQEMSPAEYVAARRFLEGLAQEAYHAPAVTGVAATVK